MITRDEKITAEAEALWREVFGGPPPPKADGAQLLDKITLALPELRYDRMRSPFLRPSLISRPRREPDPA